MINRHVTNVLKSEINKYMKANFDICNRYLQLDYFVCIEFSFLNMSSINIRL